MTEWMEVFAAGKHVSANGSERDWTAKDLLHMANFYDPAKHEAPIVVGHPKGNSPAYGWIKGLKVVGDKLLALPGQVAPEFAELVRSGRYKKRSISVYPDGTLRHVGFLGAQPPAVKGLKDIDFAEEAEETYEYAEDATMTETEKLRQELDAEKQKNQDLAAELDKTKAKAEKVQTDFAEQQAQARRQNIADFVEQGVKEARILPEWKARGIEEFMAALDGQDETYEFSEGKKQPPLDWFKGFIASFSEHPLFKTMTAPKDDQSKTSDFAEDDKLGAEIAAKVNPAKA